MLIFQRRAIFQTSLIADIVHRGNTWSCSIKTFERVGKERSWKRRGLGRIRLPNFWSTFGSLSLFYCINFQDNFQKVTYGWLCPNRLKLHYFDFNPEKRSACLFYLQTLKRNLKFWNNSLHCWIKDLGLYFRVLLDIFSILFPRVLFLIILPFLFPSFSFERTGHLATIYFHGGLKRYLARNLLRRWCISISLSFFPNLLTSWVSIFKNRGNFHLFETFHLLHRLLFEIRPFQEE